MDILFTVYCHTNKINGKKYIGITSQNIYKRWRDGKGYLQLNKNLKKYQPIFAKAVEKYGWENFEHEILAENLSEQEAKQKEIELIAYYHTYINDPECAGYNMTKGGEGRLLYSTEEEHIEAKKRATKKSYEKLKNDPIKYEKYLQYLKEYRLGYEIKPEAKQEAKQKYKDKLKNDPVAYKKYLARKAAEKARARQNPTVREKERIRTKKCQTEVKSLRKQIILLDTTFPTILNEIEKYNLKAANRCRSIKYLTELYKKFEDYTDGENNDRRED